MNGAASALTHPTVWWPIRTRNNHADTVQDDQLDLVFPLLVMCFFGARFYHPSEVQHLASGTLQSQPEKVQYLKSFNGQSSLTRLKQKQNKAAEVDIGEHIWRQAKLA